MPWIKLDDQWMDHPKIIRAGRDAREMWLASLTWCARHLTDGFFPEELLPSLAVTAGVDVANCQTFANRLVDVGLWERTKEGYYIHDYTDYNPTREQAEATKKARSEAGRAGGMAKASKTPSKTPSKSQANGKQNSAPSPSPSHIEEKKGADAPSSDEEEKPKRKPAEFRDPLWDLQHGRDPSPPTDPPPPDITWVPNDILEMVEEFLTSTKLPPPADKSTRGYWIKELRSMRLSDGLTQDDIRRAVRKMRATGGIIKSPESVRTVALDIRASNEAPNFSEVF